MKKLISSDEAIESNKQHTSPCSDCPLRRDALNGWLGGSTPEQYRQLIHSDYRVNCHAIKGPQCAGVAIYRSNVAKYTEPGILKLPVNREDVFSNPMEFLEHHNIKNISKTAVKNKRKQK